MATSRQVRRRGRFALILGTVLAAAMIVAVAGASVYTDKPDYTPGSTVTISGDNTNGAGYVPGNAVSVAVSGPNSWTGSCQATVSVDGSWSCTVTLVSDLSAVGTYTYTASSTDANGNPISETGTFTDSSGANPSSTVTFPSATYYNNASWDAGCSAGFCGTATGGRSGSTDYNVTGVALTIIKGTGVTTTYWNGTSFQSGITTVAATLNSSGHTVNWSYGFDHTKFSGENQYKVVPAASDSGNQTENGNGGKTFDIDNTAPSTSITCNSLTCSGTYSGSVTVGVSATDPVLSGNATISGSGVYQMKYTTDGSDPTSSVTATTVGGASMTFTVSTTTTVKLVAYDNAGNISSVRSQLITFAASDLTAPTTTIVLTPTTPDGANSWYVSNVNVKITATDPDDSVAETRCALDPASAPTSFADLPTTTCPYLGSTGANVTSDGTHTVYAASKDSHGNTESPIVSSSFKIDKTAPTVAVTGFTDGAVFTLGVDTLPTVGCSRSDATSGIDATGSTGPTATAGGLVNGVGSVTYTCGAKDNAGNTNSASASYSVIYNWTGFFQPVDNLPAWNSAKAGSAIPVKFNLGGNQGTNIFLSGYPKVTQIACPSAGSVTDPIETYTSTSGGSTLTYDTTAMQYVYVWKTDKAWAGKCFLFQLGLNDSTTHNFNVQFTK